MKIKFIVKVIILAVIVFIYSSIMQFASPIVANELAMNQMQNAVDSSFGIQMYTYATNYSWVVFLLILVLMFYKDVLKIIEIVKKKREKFNEEN